MITEDQLREALRQLEDNLTHDHTKVALAILIAMVVLTVIAIIIRYLVLQ